MDYKKIIKSQKARFAIIRMLQFLPDNIMLSVQYMLKMGRLPNLRKPKRFTEWLQWYKMKYRNQIMFSCVDKYKVREYVEWKGLHEILNTLYGVYQNADEIDFDVLPERFVIKTTNGGGGENVIICRDKSQLNIGEIRSKLNYWLKLKSVDAGREWAYTGINTPRIIIEKYLENTIQPDAGINDYKILCFNGVPHVIIYDCDRYIGHKRNFYDVSWNRIRVTSDCPAKDGIIPPPENLDKMLKIAGVLSSDFPFVRVDLYNINGMIYFGELTFYSWSGYVKFNPDEFDFKLGSLFNTYNKG